MYKAWAVAWLLGAGACAHAPAVPTDTMAQAAKELHRAQQAGANYDDAGRSWYVEAEDALETSRRMVFRGKNAAAQTLAQRSIFCARKAHERARLPARALEALSPVPVIAGTVTPNAAKGDD
jgi:hypothetical protein